jgi:hypothetical protein
VISVGKNTEGMCEETSACVVCILCGVVYGGTYTWLGGVFSGVQVACVVVCVAGWCLLRGPGSMCSGLRGLCGGLQVSISFCRYPVCWFTCA